MVTNAFLDCVSALIWSTISPVVRITVSGSYSFELVDRDGWTNRRPVRYTLNVVPDLPPEVGLELLGVGQSITPTAELPIELSFEDAYGLGGVSLLVQRGDDPPFDIPLEEFEPGRREFTAETVFAVGSTAGLTTTEFEPGLAKHDLKATFESIAPENARYLHEETWHDDNGHSHVRASLLGPSLTVPVVDRRMTLGTWQQVVLIDFDTRSRSRRIIVQVIGE